MNIIYFFQIVLFLFTSFFCLSCKDSTKLQTKPNEIIGLASVIQLNTEQANIVDLNDYFTVSRSIDSLIFCNKKYTTDSVGCVRLTLPDSMDFITNLAIYYGNEVYGIPVKKPSEQLMSIKFTIQETKEVLVKGEFSNWLAVPMQREDSVFTYQQLVEPSSYQFCFLRDQKEFITNDYPKVSNGIGGFNNQLIIKDARVSNPSLNFKLNSSERIVLNSNDSTAFLLAYYNNTLIVENQIIGAGYTLDVPIYTKDDEVNYLRAWVVSSTGCSKELLIPFIEGKPVMNPDLLPRDEPYRMSMYNIFVDRFYDGDSTNQPKSLDSVLPQAQYLGGDVVGLTDQLRVGYFDSLGINTLWISPLVKNAEGAWGEWKQPYSKFSSYHGYWPVSFTKLNPNFSTASEFKELVEEAHDSGKNILLDVVANHIHKNHPFYQSNPDYFTSLYLADGTLNTERWDDHRLTTWFDVFLPTMDLEKEPVYEMLSDSIYHWLNTYHIDGFRHDATKHIPEVFWKTLTKKIKTNYIQKGQGNVFQIGETYGSHQLVGSYVNSGQLNAQFDFNVYDAIMKVLCDNSSWVTLVSVVDKSLNSYGDHHLMGNISGNQDKGRSISYFGGDLNRGEDAKVAGWTRTIEIGNEEVAFKKMRLMHLLNTVLPGIPVIYYGDEIGMPGGNDPDCRRMMKFKALSQQEKELKKEVASFLHKRRNSMALIYGNLHWVLVEKDILALERSFGSEKVVVYINKSMESQHVTYNGMSFELEGLGYKILNFEK